MKKFFNWIKNWSAVIILAAFIACMVCAFVCCLVCDGKVYPILGAIAVAVNTAVLVFQIALEIKSRRENRWRQNTQINRSSTSASWCHSSCWWRVSCSLRRESLTRVCWPQLVSSLPSPRSEWQDRTLLTARTWHLKRETWR